jgi:hypothetical protein
MSYSYALGTIAVLEEKIMPPLVLEEVLKLDFQEALGKANAYLFSPQETKDIYSWEAKLGAERAQLKEVCCALLEKEELKKLFDYGNAEQLETSSFEVQCLQDFKQYYLQLTNALCFLRIQFYGLQEDFFDQHNLPRFLSDLPKKEMFLWGEVKLFLTEAEQVLKEARNYLLLFLFNKYIIRFWQQRKVLLDPTMVFWYFFAKKANLDILNFLIYTVAYSLDRKKARSAIEALYG